MPYVVSIDFWQYKVEVEIFQHCSLFMSLNFLAVQVAKSVTFSTFCLGLLASIAKHTVRQKPNTSIIHKYMTYKYIVPGVLYFCVTYLFI